MLEAWVLDDSTAPSLQQRARIILACATGKSNVTISKELKLSMLTVGKWRGRFIETRLEDFKNEHRGRPLLSLTLSHDERYALERWSQNGSALRRRAQLILECAKGKNNVEVAKLTGLSKFTVCQWRTRFSSMRMKAFAEQKHGRPTPQLLLSSTERQILARLTHTAKTPRLLQRAQIVLACAEGKTNIAIAKEMGVAKATVSKCRRRFLEQRLNGLQQKPRSAHEFVMTQSRALPHPAHTRASHPAHR